MSEGDFNRAVLARAVERLRALPDLTDLSDGDLQTIAISSDPELREWAVARHLLGDRT